MIDDLSPYMSAFDVPPVVSVSRIMIDKAACRAVCSCVCVLPALQVTTVPFVVDPNDAANISYEFKPLKRRMMTRGSLVDDAVVLWYDFGGTTLVL